MKISEALGIGLFTKLTYGLLAIFILCVTIIVTLFYIIRIYFGYENYLVIVLLLLALSLWLGLWLIKLSIAPLLEYIYQLQTLSKETLHELNIPISTIKMNMQMLQKSLKSDKKAQNRLNRIEESLVLLQARYKELDYLIKKQSNDEVDETFRLDEFVLQRVESLAIIFKEADFSTNLESFSVKVDKIALTKVIDNIIHNSVKYAKDKPEITITLKDAKLTFADRGIGMDDISLLRLFDGYYQADENAEGYGIGLHVVKRYCDANKLTLHIRSKLDTGTQISIDFKGKAVGNHTTT